METEKIPLPADVLSATAAPPTAALARLEFAIAIAFTAGAALLSIFMDRLIAEGGMREAQQFIRLTPVFFPRVAFGLMAVLGAIHGYRAWRQLSETAPPGPGSWIEKYRNVVLVGAFILAYALLLPKLGFTAATLVGIAAVTATLGSRTWWEILPVSLLSPLVIRFVFERVLLIALPRSDFEFIAVPEEALMKFLVRLFFFQF